LLQEKDIEQAISICEEGAYTRDELAYYDEYRINIMWESTLGDVEGQLAAEREALAEKNKILAEKDKLLAEKDKALAEKDKTIAERDEALAGKDVKIAKLLERISQMEQK
jgi:hypothetical protein